MRVLMVTSEWPTPDHPRRAPFLVQQVRFLREAGLHVDVYHFEGRKRPWRYVRAWRALRRQYDIRSYDLVHVHFGQSGLVALPAPVPVVVTFHGSDLQGIVGSNGKYTQGGRILRQVSRFVAGRADAVIVVAEHMKRQLPASVDAQVIPCGVDLGRFRTISQEAARRQLGFPADKCLVLFAASPTNPVKRYDLAQRAVAMLQAHREVELVVLSGVPHETVPTYMNACDVLLLTSKHEGSPMVVKEALACGLPVVAVDVGDVRERIGTVAACRVCTDDAPETIAVALSEVLAARTRVERDEVLMASIDERQLVREIIEIYRSILA